MKSLENITEDIKKGDLVRIYFEGNKSYVGYLNKKSKDTIVFSSFKGFEEGKVPLSKLCHFNNDKLEGKIVIGYDIVERNVKKKRARRIAVEERPISLDTNVEGGIGGPFRDSLSKEMAEEDEKNRRRREKEAENALDPIRPIKEY